MNKTYTLESYLINKDFIVQKKGGKTVIFDAVSSKLYTLNDTSEMILTGVQLGWDKDKITQKISEKFSVDKKIVAMDVEDCLQDFIYKKIIIRNAL